MPVFKCKMCGGNLEVQEGMTVCECEYCGSVQTVPTLDDEKKITLFTRANRLRLACEFDKASGVYESIVTEFPEEAEAYWGLILCKYGIEYVDDPKTGKKIPTCHRSSFDSVMDDPNFELVMEYSDPSSRAVYREEAKTIEELRSGIIEVSSKEAPYDIFICYKETDAMGNRTIDSAIAQDVYDALVEKGYRVFFSRITLEDKLGQEYEPYIFAALNSAKIMLAFGTDYEYYNAVWVKNEWSRFLSLISKGEKKTLIPCFKGIDAYDMPKEFARLQAQDMGKVGAIQDLLRGIAKILGTANQPTYKIAGAQSAESSALIQRGNMALEDEDFEGAESYFERALDANPSDAHAYLGKFLAFYGLKSLDDLEDKVCLLDDNKEFRRAEQFADPQLSKQLKDVRSSNEVKIERLRLIDVIKKSTVVKATREAFAAMAECTNEGYQRALSLFDSLLESKCITSKKHYSLTRNAESQFFTLKQLKSDFEMHSIFDLSGAARSVGRILRSGAIDALVAEGFVERHTEGYCWPGAKAEKERVLKEEEERRQKRELQQAAFDAACAAVEAQIQEEIASKLGGVSEDFDSRIGAIQQEINEALATAKRDRDSLQNQIADLRSKQSALGFFKGKEKKALQVQIDDVQSRLSAIPSEQKIQLEYQPRIEQIKREKATALDKLTTEIRAAHPLPRFEDFAES